MNAGLCHLWKKNGNVDYQLTECLLLAITVRLILDIDYLGWSVDHVITWRQLVMINPF